MLRMPLTTTMTGNVGNVHSTNGRKPQGEEGEWWGSHGARGDIMVGFGGWVHMGFGSKEGETVGV